MRARTLHLDRDAGAAFGLEHGLVGIGDRLPERPRTLQAAVAAAIAAHGEKAGRMLHRFAELPTGTLVWTWADDRFHLGRIDGAWRYEDGPEARAVGIHHVRPALWLERPFGEDEAPAAVVATFARGGRNLQRIHGAAAKRRTAELWQAEHRAR
jgi:hypothetical protein